MSSISDFLSSDDTALFGAVAGDSSYAIEPTQARAWKEQFAILKEALSPYGNGGLIAFEYVVPRVGKRIDVLLIIRQVLFVLEFKIGEKRFVSEAVNQVWDYALDLKNFHSTSHDKWIVPILIATKAKPRPISLVATHGDEVLTPLCATPADLGETIEQALNFCDGETVDIDEWSAGRYKPTPTIIEAAVALYGTHGVEDIKHHAAELVDFSATTDAVTRIIDDSRIGSKKSICFVTGVPGAGKTLVGLTIAQRQLRPETGAKSVFLSGNGPLVKVLREALARDRVRQEGERGRKLKLKDARRPVSALIQNVHHFRDDCIKIDPSPPHDHLAIFDEAQRAWNKEQTIKFMRQKKDLLDFSVSEPEFLISCMNRHEDWACIVCLVGGGQEINTGEAGIGEWIRAVKDAYPKWHIHLSPKLHDSEYAAGKTMEMLLNRDGVHVDEKLHLSVSMRSFRAEYVSAFVKHLLDIDIEESKRSLSLIRDQYPIVITRDLHTAKAWLRSKARANERFGMVVSSQAQRLKPLAIDVRVDVNPIHWFLHGRNDVRSSYFLEDVATEFEVQGLELDWACVVWDGDLRRTKDGWDFRSFRGKKWQQIAKPERQTYLKNAYRVLLTRARQGMVIVVPQGSTNDQTRSPEFYDDTFEYLKELGLGVV